jgi:hypothetical protein
VPDGLWLAVALDEDVTDGDAVVLGDDVAVSVAVALGDGEPVGVAVVLDDGVADALDESVELEEPDGVAVELDEAELDGDAVADTVRSDARLRPCSVMRATSVSLPSHSTASRTPLASRPLGMSCVTLTYT